MTIDITAESLSKLWWGNALRLRAASWIRALPEHASFYQSQMAKELATEAPYVRRELELLVTLGAITALPQEAGERRVFYQADRAHPIWNVVDAAAVCLAQLNSPGSVTALK